MKYFEFAPEQPMAGVTFTPLMGEVVPGRIYEVAQEDVAAVLQGHPDWESSSRKAYEAQNEEN